MTRCEHVAFGGGESLSLTSPARAVRYRVYPHMARQRDALFGGAALLSDARVRALLRDAPPPPGCVRLEVIFV
jgi:hypothetical protein